MPPDEAAAGADLVLLAVPDDVLPGLVRGLAAAGCFRPGQIVVHTSGAHGVAVLDPATEHGVLPLALHPVMTFTGRTEDVARLAGASVGVTATAGEEAAWSVGEALVVEMGAEPVRVPEAVRPLYHAALAHGANHLITLVRDCVDVLERAGVHPAERLVAPLLSAALDNALRHGDRALTGPVARGDAGTVRTHLRELDAVDPDLAADLPRPGRPHRPPGAARRPAARPRRGRGARHPRGGAPVTTARTRGGYTPGELTVHTSPAAISPVTRALRAAGRRIALVPTMGALHEGHRELIRHARRMPGAGVVAVSIFVNPLQFGPNEDLARYPRPLEADLQICRDGGRRAGLRPRRRRHVPARARRPRPSTPGRCGAELEGAVRPGHFAGVLTVVAKLFHIVAPDVAFFGEKDYQQLVLIKRMVARPELPARRRRRARPSASRTAWRSPRATPTSRPSSGRSPRRCSARSAAGAGVSARGPEAVLVDAPARSSPPSRRSTSTTWSCAIPTSGRDPQAGRARLLVAARLGTTRLIDNVAVQL